MIALAALAAGCSTPYMARSGPVPACDASGEPLDEGRPFGVCTHQLRDYQRLMQQLGYSEAAAEAPTRHSVVHQWSRMRSDTTDAVTVEFAVEWTTYLDGRGGARLLRIAVSGRSFVVTEGKERGVEDQADVRRDVDDVAGFLRDLFVTVPRVR